MKKILSLMLVCVMILTSSIAFTSALYDGENLHTDASTWAKYKQDHGVPFELPMKSDNGFPFNRELFEDQQIAVYGTYEDVPGNNYKYATGHLNTEGVLVVTENTGYYGGTGEWRYHGYDAVGNKYANGNFPVDANSGRRASDKSWIYRIWDKSSPFFKESRLSDASDYNRAAIHTDYQTKIIQPQTRKWINETLPFEIVTTEGGNTDKNPYNYAHVLSRPTTLFGGEALMYHKVQGGGIWYQMFSLDPMKGGKQPTPMEAALDITSKDDTLSGETGGRTYKITVSGTLKDERMYDGIDEDPSDDVLRGAYYNREDIKDFSFSLTDGVTGKTYEADSWVRTGENTAEGYFTVSLTQAQYEAAVSEKGEAFTVPFKGRAQVNYYDNEFAFAYAGDEDLDMPPVAKKQQPVILKIKAPYYMLDTERFKIEDQTIMTPGSSREVTLDGVVLSESEANDFLSGSYLFDLTGNDVLHTYTVTYTDGTGKTEDWISYVLVYTTKPRAQVAVTGTFKENRRLEAVNASAGVNSSYLTERAALTPIFFNALPGSGDTSSVKFREKTDSKLVFLSKKEQDIEIPLKLRSDVAAQYMERSDIPPGYHLSDTYTYELITLADYEPAVICNIWNTPLARTETLDMTYDAVSTDGDTITVNRYRLYYDEDGDLEAETLLFEGAYSDFGTFKPEKLGVYKLFFDVEEAFGQETLEEFILPEDHRRKTLERTFYADNLAPMTKLYTDIEYEFPKVDLITLADADIDRDKMTALLSERIAIMNGMRQKSVEGNVQMWDLHTYVYTQEASTSKNTGGSVPPMTTSYSAGGYSGTLDRYDYKNNPYTQDDGYTQKTVKSASAPPVEEDNTGTASYVYRNGSWRLTATYVQNGLVQLPGSMPYSSDGWTGTLYKTGGRQSSDDGEPSGPAEEGETYERSTTWTAVYTGTIYKTVYEWVSVWNSYDDYTGYYKGTIYKNVKQAFTPVFRVGANRYLLYMARDTFMGSPDIKDIQSQGSVKVILASGASLKDKVPHDHYIDGNAPLETVIDEVIRYIQSENPYVNKYLRLVSEPFDVFTAEADEENDPLSAYGVQLVHDAQYFDNSMGHLEGARQVFSDEKEAFNAAVPNTFPVTGRFSLYRRIKDAPEGVTGYDKDSNTPLLDIYVHRKPIADFDLDWDYDAGTKLYKTTWIDLSYDLDHSESDAEKGIRDRQIRYKKSGAGAWIYAIPDRLSAGTYEVRYIVKDMEGVWSDEAVKHYTLRDAPPIQFSAKLRSRDSEFDLKAMPATEWLELYDIRTRYPYAHQLGIAMVDNRGNRCTEERFFLSAKLPKNRINDNNYNWPSVTLQIPEISPDGAYAVQVRALPETGAAPSSAAVEERFDFTVKTPVDIEGQLPDDILAGEPTTVRAETGRYAASASVELCMGTSYAQTHALIRTGSSADGERLYWEAQVTVPDAVPDGTYGHRFTAKTAGGNKATDILERRVVHLAIESGDITGYWNHWRGQDNIFGHRMTLEPHRFLTYEKIKIEVAVKGAPDSVEVRLSPELEAMVYENRLGQVYQYADEIGHTVAFPIRMSKVASESHAETWQVTYILPVCPETKSWENAVLRVPYWAEITARKGTAVSVLRIEDIDITGNVHDLMYVQPQYK